MSRILPSALIAAVAAGHNVLLEHVLSLRVAGRHRHHRPGPATAQSANMSLTNLNRLAHHHKGTVQADFSVAVEMCCDPATVRAQI